MSDDDAVLVSQARAGSEAAFTALVERYMTGAVRLAYSILYDWEDAKDCAQEAFVKAYYGLSRFRGHAQFSTWLFRIVINQCHDALRRRSRHRQVAEPAGSGPNILEALPDRQPDPATASEQHELGGVLTAALAALPPRQRVAATLHFVHGYTVREIAQLTGAAVGTVKAHVWQAQRRLRRLLHPYVTEERTHAMDRPAQATL